MWQLCWESNRFLGKGAKSLPGTSCRRREEEGEPLDLTWQIELVVPMQPAWSLETSPFVRALPQSELPKGCWACMSAAWLRRGAQRSLGLALRSTERVRGHGCFSMVTIVMPHRAVWSPQRCFHKEFRLCISCRPWGGGVLLCLGFSVAGWNFELLVECGRWLEETPDALGWGVSAYLNLHLQKLVTATQRPAEPLSLGETQPCPALVVSWGLELSQGCESLLHALRSCQQRGWGAGSIFQSTSFTRAGFMPGQATNRVYLSGREAEEAAGGVLAEPRKRGAGEGTGAVGGRWQS